VPSDRYTGETVSVLPLDVIDRCELAERQLADLSDEIRAVGNQLHSEGDSLQRQIMALQDRLTNLLHRQPVLDTIQITERFQDDNLDPGSLYRDSLFGALTLRPIGWESATTSIADIWIDRSNSVGNPGNHMVVDRIEWNEQGLPTVHLVGESDPHANLFSAFDQNPESWVEWERVVVRNKQPLQQFQQVAYFPADSGQELDVWAVTQGYGWDILVSDPNKSTPIPSKKAELLPNVDGQEPAKLTLEMVFTEIVQDVWLEILPYHIGGRGFVVDSIMTSQDGVNWKESASKLLVSAANTEGSSNTGAVRVFLNDVKYVRLSLRSLGWYQPSKGLGHPFVARTIQETKRTKLLGFITLDSKHSQWTERVPTQPELVGSLAVEENGTIKLVSRVIGGVAGLITGLSMKVLTQALGAQLVAALGTLAGPIAFVVGALTLGGFILRQEVERNVTNVVQGIDVFRGWRSAIGIREIRLVRHRYQSSGEWVSPVYRFYKPVRQIAVYAHDDVPNGTELSYQVRVGSQWIDVDVHSLSGGNVVRLDQPVSEMQIKIQMRSSQPSLTPIVYSLMAEGLA